MSVNPSIVGPFSAKPAAGLPNRIYYATDTGQILFDNGTSWDSITLISAGQGDAVAAGGETLITLGSTPLARSVSVYVGGSILRPSTAYTISGGVITLFSSLTAGQVVCVNWATANSTPGGIALSTTGILAIAGWAMNEGSGLTLHDSVGSNHATINSGGSITWQANTGLPGTTPQWNGSGYALAASSSLTNFDGTTPFSASVWTDITHISTAVLMGNIDTGSAFKGWELSLQNAAVKFFLVNNYPSNAIDVVQTPAVFAGFFHIVVTYDGSRSASGVKLYMNGASVALTTNVNTLTSSAASGLPVRFGARNDGSNKLSDAMAFAEIYNFVLTSTQVAAFYASGPGLY